jgi:formylglycine-generating enzyme required for sulfatase activity
MVAVTTSSKPYCIDAYEVTQAEYQKFLNGNPTLQPDPCSTNDLDPSCDEFDATAHPSRPAVCVDWCDARAFCTAAGKRLCGQVGGGAADVADATNADLDEWFRACSAAGTQKFPYGLAYAAKCNDINAPTTSVVDVGFFADCVGGYPGLYDMSGNVREWEDACNVNGCYVRGGGYTDLQDNVSCAAAILTTRTAASKDLGFRCCTN